MKERFLASDWAHRTPAEIEIAVETVIDGIAVRGRIDAVFPAPGGWLHDRRLEDRGQAVSGDSGATRALQLAAYRVAFARLRGLDLDDVDAAFYYAGTGETDLAGPARRRRARDAAGGRARLGVGTPRQPTAEPRLARARGL